MEKIVAQGPVDISISVVSHSQIGLVAALLTDLQSQCQESSFEVILTLNLDEDLPFAIDRFPWPVKVVRNQEAQGFSANHNQAFKLTSGRYFCVVNPDIRLVDNPFPALITYLKDPSVGVVAPLVRGADGAPEDSARRFPSPLQIFRKISGNAQLDYEIGSLSFRPDWVGGMFMLYTKQIFQYLGGFDERYFLYYEDVDICARLRLLDYDVAVCVDANVVHHAQRASHKSFRYRRWHLMSMARFFLSPVYRNVRMRFRP
jgi:N-acetylglucosaminyl-diphospho-decaprenol L-rhamnosyltransferase